MIRVYTRVADLGGGQKVVLFHGVTNEDLEGWPPVSLSRIPDHCFFGIGSLHLHDNHSPPWDLYQGEDMEKYRQRVLDGIKAIVGAKLLDRTVLKSAEDTSVTEGILKDGGYELALEL